MGSNPCPSVIVIRIEAFSINKGGDAHFATSTAISVMSFMMGSPFMRECRDFGTSMPRKSQEESISISVDRRGERTAAPLIGSPFRPKPASVR